VARTSPAHTQVGAQSAVRGGTPHSCRAKVSPASSMGCSTPVSICQRTWLLLLHCYQPFTLLQPAAPHCSCTSCLHPWALPAPMSLHTPPDCPPPAPPPPPLTRGAALRRQYSRASPASVTMLRPRYTPLTPVLSGRQAMHLCGRVQG
jgi:hypothetical protein